MKRISRLTVRAAAHTLTQLSNSRPSMLSKNCFTLPFYIPRICRTLNNWPEYLFNYVSRVSRPAEYRMRNGARLIDETGALPGTMAVVFVRREYGPLKRFRTIVDIGAHRGTFAVHAAHASPEAKVYCYEPEQRNFAFLQQNIDANGLGSRVSAFRCAVGASKGPRKLAVGTSLLNSFHIIPEDACSQTVNCTTVNEIFARHELDAIDLLKMNCEGAEYEILESCSRADFDRIANIRLEYHNLTAPNSGESLSGFLATRGFKLERFTRYLNKSGFIWVTKATLMAFWPEALALGFGD
jgi:FkbM family methyltransferase